MNFSKRYYAARSSMPFVIGLLLVLAIISGANLPSAKGTAGYVHASATSPILADSCTAQLVSPLSTTYYNENGQIVVPVSATCSFTGGQLYAVGNAADLFGTNLGSTNTVLTSVNGGNVFNGQLIFTIPLSIRSDTVQISVSIYSNGPNGSSLTSAAQTIQVISLSHYGYPGYYWYYP